MKWTKIIIVCLLIFVILFLAFHKSRRINLEGNWETKKIILDGKKIYPDTLSNYIDFSPKIIINNWTKTISIPIDRKDFEVQLIYLEEKNKGYQVKLSSSEKSLNGIFDVRIDTFDIKSNSYTVDVELKSNQTLLHFQKNVIIPLWKPDTYRKGRP